MVVMAAPGRQDVATLAPEAGAGAGAGSLGRRGSSGSVGGPERSGASPRTDPDGGPSAHPEPAHTAPVGSGRLTPDRELLALLRRGSGARPRFDPKLAGGLRAWLEDAAADLARSQGEAGVPLFFGSSLAKAMPTDGFPLPGGRRVHDHRHPPRGHGRRHDERGQEADTSQDEAPGRRPAAFDRGVRAAVRVLFRQLVVGGEVGDAVADAMEAFGV